MRFTISREKLQEGLAAVTASIPAKTTLPVLANILVEATEKGIRLSGTDLDIAVTTEVAADVELSGAITIPAKKLSEIARELPPAPVRIAAVGEQRVSTEESRPILNGVLWELKPDMMRMVATNGHRLAKMEMTIKSAGAPPCDLIVPPKALDQIRRLFPEDEELEIAKGENPLGFRSPFTAVFTRLIE